MKETIRIEEIKQNIIEGKDKFFSFGDFVESNMADYGTFQYTVEDLSAVYGINEADAAGIVMELTHPNK